MCSSRTSRRGWETASIERSWRSRGLADDIRASDEDREKVVAELSAHASAGRLSHDELEERMEAAYAARTLGELRELVSDVPAREGLFERSRPRSRSSNGGEIRAFLMVSVLLVAIWALTGAGYFWPIWPIGGWGLALMMPGCGARRQRVSGRSAERLARV